MEVMKFGGASVRDASSIKNVLQVVNIYGFIEGVLVVSAMGKTTNALERVVDDYFNSQNYHQEINKIKEDHLEVAKQLFEENDSVFHEIDEIFDDLYLFLDKNKSPNYSFVYDQTVSAGEILSSKMLSRYLAVSGFNNTWLDSRDYIKTDSSFQEGVVNWEKTLESMGQLESDVCYVTQGFIASDDDKFTVTLGREGSDYSAAIFAYCLDAERMTIWKDVPGVMTADPRKFPSASLLDHISYEEAIEMAYYGASVIHPKTLQPLKQKHIRFFIKSFIDPVEKGTEVSDMGSGDNRETIIVKDNQAYLTLSTNDFSFIAEHHLSEIFQLLAKYKIKISVMQNTAISLELCLEDKFGHLNLLVDDLKSWLKIDAVRDVSLFTIRHSTAPRVAELMKGRKVLLEQSSNETFQAVVKN